MNNKIRGFLQDLDDLKNIEKSLNFKKLLKNLKKSHEVLKKLLEILKSPLFQTLNNYFRIFRCYQKTKGRRKGKRKENLRKRQI